LSRIIVTGSKYFDDYSLLKNKLDNFLKDILPNVVIVSGESEGVELLSEKYAVERGLDLIGLPIQWDRYGKRAALIRNEIMFANSDYCLIFWDGKSKDRLYSRSS
jgi:hypothetical protein